MPASPMKTSAELTAAIAALEEAKKLLWARCSREEYGHAKTAVTLDVQEVQDLTNQYRAQLAALPEEPSQPWTDRERRLRERLERLVREETPIKQPYKLPKCRICNRSAFHEPDCPYAEAIKVLAAAPPPDTRDEALEELERVIAGYGGDATGCNAQWLLEKVIAAIARAKGGK